MQGFVANEYRDDPTKETRAFCALCAVKEFLVCVTLFLIAVDVCDVYANVIRVTGTELLPFPGNHTAFYYTRVPELNWYDMIISTFDLSTVVVLSLSGTRAPSSPRPWNLGLCSPDARARVRSQCAPTRWTGSSAASAASPPPCSSSLSMSSGWSSP